MKPKFLFPPNFKYLGYLLALPGFVLGYLNLYQHYKIPGFEYHFNPSVYFNAQVQNFTDELALTLVIIGLLLIAFSKVKGEDELTARIRLYALHWAILTNYALYAALTLFLLTSSAFYLHIDLKPEASPFNYYLDLSIYNLFTPLVLFIAIFYYLLYRNKNEFLLKPIKYLNYKPYHFIGKWVSVVIIVMLIANYIVDSKYGSDYILLSFVLLPLSLVVWAYSKNRIIEDEYIDQIRAEAMQIAIYVNYSILLLSTFLVYGWDFWDVQFINLVTIPLIFIAWLKYRLYVISKQSSTINTVLL